ncbi:MAG: hypothetical protein AB7N70_36345 [Dehalococcoidia bacterium]
MNDRARQARHKRCTSKRRYATEGAAIAAAARAMYSGRTGFLRVYHCTDCGTYHLTETAAHP